MKVTGLLGAFSSIRYEHVNYPHKENEYCHLLFAASLEGGGLTAFKEALNVGWFAEGELPPRSDGHEPRIQFGFRYVRGETGQAYFE